MALIQPVTKGTNIMLHSATNDVKVGDSLDNTTGSCGDRDGWQKYTQNIECGKVAHTQHCKNKFIFKTKVLGAFICRVKFLCTQNGHTFV